MKKVLFILQMIVPYVFLGTLFYTGNNLGGSNLRTFEAIQDNAIYVVMGMCLITSIYSFIIAKYMKAKDLLFYGMLIKIVNIPIYLTVFLLGFFAVLTIRGIIALPILAFFDYILMLPSSCICINGYIRGKKEVKIGSGLAIILSVLQFFFVLDFIAAVAGYIKVKK